MGSGLSHGGLADPNWCISLVNQRRVTLVETLDFAPGLLPFQAWDALSLHATVYLRDVETHPSAADLYFAGVDLATLTPAALDRSDLDLNRPGSPDDRRIAKALAALAIADDSVVYLLGPNDSGVSAALAGIAPEHDIEIELVLFAQQPLGIDLIQAVQVVATLRDPDGGCPWDLAQDHESLVRHLIEEAFELVDAIESGDDRAIREELGDVLLQVLLHAQIASDRKAFGIDVVARELAEKLIRRHPHVFADGDAATPADVQTNWDTLKAKEKRSDAAFEGVPNAAPGLQLITQLQSRAAKLGYERAAHTPDEGNVAAGIGQFFDGVTDEHFEAQFGGVLDALVAQARQRGIDPDTAARVYAQRFRRQFETAHNQLRGTGDTTPTQTVWQDELSRAAVDTDDADLTEETADE